MTTQDRHEIEQLIAKWRIDAEQFRCEAERARVSLTVGPEAENTWLTRAQLATAYADDLESLSALLAEVPPQWECPNCTRPVRNGDIACPWCKHHLGRHVSPVVAEVPPPPELEMCTHCGKRPAANLCQECLK